MSADRVKLRFLRPYAAYRKGDTVEMDRGPAKSLILAEVVELVGEQPQLELAMPERRNVETADATPRRRRR
jgi:hypothetical protein